jgi:hypothetical protein
MLQGAKLSWKEKTGEEILEEIKPPIKTPATEAR